MRLGRKIALLVAVLLFASCVRAPADSVTTTVPPVGTSADPNTTAVASVSPASATLGPERTPTDRSLLEPGINGERSGRFRIRPGWPHIIPMSDGITGRYWVVDDGRVYTALDLDLDLVKRVMADLAGSIDPELANYRAAVRSHYDGDQFQLLLVDFLQALGDPAVSADYADMYFYGAQVDEEVGEMLPVIEECRAAIADYEATAVRWASDLVIDPVDQGGRLVWQVPVDDLRNVAATEVNATNVCDIMINANREPTEVHVAIARDDMTSTLEWGSGRYALVTIEMTPDDSIGALPDVLSPEPFFLTRSTYLVAISECGELPWAYSGFAGSDSYGKTAALGYLGFTSDWVCADAVPTTTGG